MHPPFFTIDPSHFMHIIATRNLHINNSTITIPEIINKLHINTDSGNFDIEKGQLLHKFLHENCITTSIDNTLSIQSLYRKYSTHFYGSNKIITSKRKTITKVLVEHCKDKTLLLLFIASILSLIIGVYKTVFENEKYGYMEGITIMLAIFIIIILGTVNVISQSNLFDNLNKKMQNLSVTVYKNYVMDTINSENLVVGNIVFLEIGNVIPADCLLISDDVLIVDEMMISGEKCIKYKSMKEDPFLISGTYITEGSAKGIVICTGMNSVKGKILKQMNNREKKTPLEHKIELLAANLTRYSIIVSLILLVCHTIKMILGRIDYSMHTILLLLVESISIVIMAVPEGLPMVVTLALSFCTKRMLNDNILVKDISACETMNNTNYICTDKTGTLTHNELIIRYLYVGNKIFYINERNFKLIDDFCSKITKHTNADLVFKNMILNSSAFENSKNNFIGSKSEIAFLKIMKKHKVDYELIRREYKVIRRKPFSSQQKYMSTIIQYNNKYYTFYKGAPEIISKFCVKDNSENKISFFNRQNHNKFVKKCDRRCFRVMAFAYAVTEILDIETINLGKIPCTFLCAVAMEDLVRFNVKREIDLCRQAGINIVMLTGDKMEMAEHLAIRLGIHTHNDLSITGHFMREKTDAELRSIIENVKVLAKALPEDKKRFVEILQSKGNIVAVTGDGTNDGPALKSADVGFGMGISGTDIAKEASSMILMNDNFASIVKSIEWGRCVNNSVKRYIQFQLTTTITTITIAVMNSILSKPGKSIFSPLKLLWINLFMGTFAALALSTDIPTKNHLSRSPESQYTSIITNNMKIFIISTSIYQFFIMSFLYITKQNSTFIYNVFIFLHIFNLINARCLDIFESPFYNLFDNYIFILTNFVALICQFLIVNNLNYIFKTSKLSLNDWIISVCIASTIVCYYFFVRFAVKVRIRKQGISNCVKSGWDDAVASYMPSCKSSEIFTLDI